MGEDQRVSVGVLVEFLLTKPNVNSYKIKTHNNDINKQAGAELGQAQPKLGLDCN